MRLVQVVVALGLLAGRTLAQQLRAIDLPNQDISPRFYLEASPQIAGRGIAGCADGSHPCSDINSTSCCPNDQYCMVDPSTWGTRCCDFGSQCGGPCPEDYYEANQTSTTTSGTSTITGVTAGCTQRKCTSTNYLCAENFGGGCCDYGLVCVSGGSCIGTSSSSTAVKTVAWPIPIGCTATTQIACPASLGGGCCEETAACAIVSETSAVCSSTGPVRSTSTSAATSTASGVTVTHTNNGLSTGAKAGIAVGVVIVAALIIGALTWYCIRQRRGASRRQSTTQGSRNHEMQSTSNAGDLRPYGANSGPHMSEGAASSTQLSRPGGPLRGLTTEYYGPQAAYGPYSDPAPASTSHGFLSRAVPSDPHGPEDIVVPVEIGHQSSVRKPRLSQANSGDSIPRYFTPMHESIDNRFELYGTEIEPGQAQSSSHVQEIESPDPEQGYELGTPSPISMPRGEFNSTSALRETPRKDE